MWDTLVQILSEWMTEARTASAIRVLALVGFGIPLAYWTSRILRRVITDKYTPHHGHIAGRAIFYSALTIIVLMVMHALGLSIAPLLGAAGIVGIAIGFASQTSVSNVISGLFLLAEKPFVIGDVISVAGTTGQVLSIDMLSVKLRQFDNRYVRIPNETMIKSEVANITRFPIRRADLNIGVAYKEDIARVREVLIDVAHNNPLCLEEPEPVVIFVGYGSSSIDLLFAVWAAKADWLKLKNSLLEEIKARFDKEGIEIPFPHLSLYTGLATEPFPIRIVNGDEQRTAEPAGS